MNINDFGTLRIRLFEASEALPIENAVVRITGSSEYNSDVQISLLTDNNGLTEEVKLPAPKTSLSLSPAPPDEPYSVFDVEIIKEGYYLKSITNVPIFAGIKATLPIVMIPMSYYENGTLIPLDNLNSTIYENENL